jgi:hypothetical protein
LAKYARQIGILPNEVPKLIINKKEIQELLLTKSQMNAPELYKDKSKTPYGLCISNIRAIFVDVHRIIEEEIQSTDCLHTAFMQDTTLVHELIHYRLPYMQHGAKFEERTREILRGQVFEPEHIPEMICGDCHRPVLMGKQEEKK